MSPKLDEIARAQLARDSIGHQAGIDRKPRSPRLLPKVGGGSPSLAASAAGRSRQPDVRPCPASGRAPGSLQAYLGRTCLQPRLFKQNSKMVEVIMPGRG